MARWRTISFSIVLAAFGMASAMAAPLSPRRHVAVDLLTETTSVQPGQTVTVAIREKIEPGWHTYWTNPGDSGEPTSIVWNLADGLTAGPILWPVPHTIPIGPLTNYGYENEVLLLTKIQVPQQIAPGSVTLAGKVTYLVCKDICVPEEADVSLTLPVADKAEPSSDAGQIANAQNELPTPLPGVASYSADSAKNALRLVVNAQPELFKDVTEVRFFPLIWGPVSNAAPQVKNISGGQLTLDLSQGDSKETPEKLEGVLVLTKGTGQDSRKGYSLSATLMPKSALGGGGAANSGQTAGGGSQGSASQSTAGTAALGGTGVAMLFAFLGGLILNLMPCVFPVLALKALSFASATSGGHRQQGVAYLGGVLASFAVLSAFIAVLRESSAALGWGFQFQSPVFVLGLAVLFFVMGLSLSGVVSFGGGLMSAGDRLTMKPGNTGYFFTGVLAAVAATPCTAPLMGAAIGYAMTQPSPVLVAIMLALGVGFALPVVALSFSPALQRILPKPGAWMETLKQVLAFPLYATAAWLVWVLSIQLGSDGVMAAALAFVGIGFAAWLAHKTAFSSLFVKLFAPALAAAALALAVSVTTTAQTGISSPQSAQASLIEEPFSRAKLSELVAQGRPVFVNLTAAWCITCKVNERVALKSAALAEAFKSAGVTYLKGDWTKANPEITELLQHFGRAGVPLYLLYPGHGGEPRILPQILTTGAVLDEIKTLSATSGTSSAKGA